MISYNFLHDRVVPTCPKKRDFRFSAPARPRDGAAIAQRGGWRRAIYVPGPNAGGRGRRGGARGRKDENPAFRDHSSLNVSKMMTAPGILYLETCR